MYPIRTPSDGYAVYIHVPFCNRRCPYCDFYLRTDPQRKLPSFYPSIDAEIALYGIGSISVTKISEHPFAEAYQTGAPSSLFIGGGTPSLLSPEQVADWITFWRTRGLPESAEVTLEANPEDRARYRVYAEAGINRLSIGCQSFHDDELQQLGRTHTRSDIEAAYLSARDAGFTSVSLDLIYALPFSDTKRWQTTLLRATALEPDHISCYALTVDPGTAFHQRWRRGEFTLPNEQQTEAELMLTFDLLSQAGYHRYELSNFAKPDHHSRHNLAYWTGIPYLALGPSAHGYSGTHRYANVANFDAWQQKISDKIFPVETVEYLSQEQHRIETIAMQLRLADGLDYRNPELQIDPVKIEQILSSGWAIETNDRICLTSSGLVREIAISRLLL